VSIAEGGTVGDISTEQKKQIRADLEQDCGLDIEAMVWIVGELQEISH
jgi:hypothetical protein